MPVSPKTVTTTIFPTVFSGDVYLNGLSFKNGSAAGIIYMLNRKHRNDVVSSTVNDFSLTAGQSVKFTRLEQGADIIGPWDAISDTGGGVTLEIIPFWAARRT